MKLPVTSVSLISLLISVYFCEDSRHSAGLQCVSTLCLKRLDSTFGGEKKTESGKGVRQIKAEKSFMLEQNEK